MKVKIINFAVVLAMVLSMMVAAVPVASAGTGSIFAVDTGATSSPNEVERGMPYTVEILGIDTAWNVGTFATISGDGIVVHSTTPTSPTRLLVHISVAHTASLTERDVCVTTGAEILCKPLAIEVVDEPTCPQMTQVHWFVGDICDPCAPENDSPLDIDGVIDGLQGQSWDYAFATIQFAIDVAEERREANACDGCPCPYKDEESIDIIHVAPGVYDECIVISETLTIMSDSTMDTCELSGVGYAPGPGTAGIVTDNVNTIIQCCDTVVSLIGADQYSWYDGTPGSEVTAVAHFEGFTVQGGEACIVADGANIGIQAETSAGAEIVDNIVNATNIGIDVLDSCHIQILDNVVNVDSNQTSTGINIGISAAANVDGNEVNVGLATPIEGYGIYVVGSPAIVINDNDVTVNATMKAYGIIVISSPGAVVTLNDVVASIVCYEICETECLCVYDPITVAKGILIIDCKNVLVDDNDVDVNARARESSEGWGIAVVNSQFAVVSNNTDVNVDVELTGANPCIKNIFAIGITMIGCLLSDVVNNTVVVTTDCDAAGCEAPDCGDEAASVSTLSEDAQQIINELALQEEVDLQSGCFNLIAGIVVLDCESILIDNNNVDVTSNNCPLTCSQCFRTAIIGILVLCSGQSTQPCCLDARPSKVTNNCEINVTANAGICVLVGGIKVFASDEIIIDGNCMNIVGSLDGDPAQCRQTGAGAGDAAVDSMMDEVLGLSEDAELAVGIGFGIWVCMSDLNIVNDNQVYVDMDVDVEDYDGQAEADALAAGAVAALGIMETFALAPQVTANGVVVEGDVTATATEESPEWDLNCALGGGIALSVGIGALITPGILIDNNTSEAYATVVADVADLIVCGDKLIAESAAATLDSEVMTVVADVVAETMQAEVIDKPEVKPIQPVDTFALGGALAAGVGIVVIGCDNASVTNNPVVKGQGIVDVEVGPTELLPVSGADADSFAAGLGLGIGIVALGSCPIDISGNADVDGIGQGDATVAAVDPYHMQIASAFGGAAGVGLGIIAISPMALRDQVALPFTTAEISNNDVYATGGSYVLVGAYAGGLPSEACAIALGLGAGLGITLVGYPFAEIYNNDVIADGHMDADAEAIAISGDDPYVIGAGAGIGVGITTVYCYVVGVMQNNASANGLAEIDLCATENHYVEIMQAGGAGAGLGLGIGILASNCVDALIGGIPDEGIEGNFADGTGKVAVNVITKDNQPLGEAWEIALGAGIGKGIVVTESMGIFVENCNHAWGDGIVSVYSLAEGVYTCDADLGIAVDADISVVKSLGVRVNYNSMLDPDTTEANSGPVLEIDAGLLVLLACEVDARYNYWNDPTGPSATCPIFGMGYGVGEPLIAIGYVEFEPWLYVEHTECLDRHIGKFGFSIPLCYCWNTFSTPISLHSSGDTWEEILENSGVTTEVQIIYRYDGGWVQVTTANDDVDPLHGFYMRMNDDARMLLYTNDQMTMPTRQLSAGWNLVGPNPPFYDYAIDTDIAMASVTDDENLAFVVSEAVGDGPCAQYGWMWSPSQECHECMYTGEAYFAWMNEGDILAGQGFTPIRTLYPDSDGCSDCCFDCDK